MKNEMKLIIWSITVVIKRLKEKHCLYSCAAKHYILAAY